MHGFDITAHTPSGERRIHFVAINEAVALDLAKRSFGSGASLFYNYVDLRFRNPTAQTLQLLDRW